MKRIISACAALAMGAGVMTMAAGSVYGAPNELQNLTREEAGATVSNNFYCYANFEELKAAELPYDLDYALPEEDWTAEALAEFILGFVENREKYPYGSNEQKIADCYLQYADNEARNSADVTLITDAIEKIEGVKDINEFIAVSADLSTNYGATNLIRYRIDAGIYDSSKYSAIIMPMSMPVEPDSFFKEYGTAENVQRTYRRVIELRGGENAALRAKNATDMIMDIADHTLTDNEASTNCKHAVNCPISELKAMFSADISPYTDIPESRGETHVTLADPEGLKYMAEKLTDENLQAWKDNLVTMLLLRYADCLPDEYVSPLSALKGSTGYYGKTAVLNEVKSNMTKELDFIFAEKYADESRIEAAREFVKSIIAEYERLIEDTEGLDETAMAGFKKKLENCRVSVDIPREPYIGAYDWKPAEKGGSLLENTIMKNRCQIKEKYDKLGTPFDKEKYDIDSMPSYTYDNACYHTANYVTIPYATICEPFFSPDNSLAHNLGRLGFTVGHEISHAFDSNCVNFDADGNLNPDWIGPRYRELLDEKERNITELFDSKKLFGIYPLDGAKTLGENMADIASCQCMLRMLNTREEKREFFETYARGWFIYCYDTVAFDQLLADEHSLNEFRVNTVLSQMDDFYEVYGITEGDMYTAPADRRRVW